MTLKVPDVTLIASLDDLMEGRYLNAKIKLYKNDITPDETSELADFTEANFSGYAEQTLVPDGTAAIVDGKAQQSFDDAVFSHDGGATPNDIFGYFVVDSTETDLLWAERYASAPATLNGSGQTYTVEPVLTLDS